MLRLVAITERLDIKCDLVVRVHRGSAFASRFLTAFCSFSLPRFAGLVVAVALLEHRQVDLTVNQEVHISRYRAICSTPVAITTSADHNVDHGEAFPDVSLYLAPKQM